MLSKTAMLLVPAASLVGAAALAPTTSLAHSAENHGCIAVNYPYCQENPSDSKCQQNSPPPTRAPKERCTITATSSVAKRRRVVSTDRVEPTSKEIEQSRVTNATRRTN